MGYRHRKVAENSQTTIYERTDEGLLGWGILAADSKDYVAIGNLTGAAVSGHTVGEARAKLAQVEAKPFLRHDVLIQDVARPPAGHSQHVAQESKRPMRTPNQERIRR